jgi:hypothetical protein
LLAVAVGGEMESEIAAYVARFVRAHPGVAHPLSDRWAVSLAPVAIVLGRHDAATLDLFFEGVIRWIGDRYDASGIGLASVDDDARTEIDYLLGAALEFVRLARRRDSFVAAVVLDLAAATARGEIFSVARNDFLATNAIPCLMSVEDGPDQFRRDGAYRLELNVPFAEAWPGSWPAAPHHEQAAIALERAGRLWEALAIQATVRNWHYASVARALVGEATAETI